MLKKLVETPAFRNLVAGSIAAYYRFVRRTCRLVAEPADCFVRHGAPHAMIVTVWHGEHFMLPFAQPAGWRVAAMISRSRDGELNALVAEKLGIATVRASGGRSGKEVSRRGGVAGFIAMAKMLEAGRPVMMTADVPKVARVVGEGIVQLARRSGAPIVPYATVTSRRKRLSSWDRAAFNLPFGRYVIVAGDPISVAPDADAAEIEAKRLEVQAALDRVTARAYELAGGRDV